MDPFPDDDLEYEPPFSAQQPRPSSSPDIEPAALLQNDNNIIPTAREDSTLPSRQRPNKHNGSATTWRDWTATERDVSRSLDMLKARDLSVHLYNAHALVRRAEQSNASAPQSDVDNPAWRPPTGWTAWPLPSDEIRSDDFPPESAGSYTHSRGLAPQDRSRETLRDTLLAQITKTARSRFVGRECEGCDGMHPYHNDTHSQQEPDTVDGQESDTWKEKSLTQSPPLQRKRSHSEVSAGSSRSRKSRGDATFRPELEPVPIADDDIAMRLAKPSIEHIISSLEQLLGGLHTARQYYFRKPKQNSSFGRGKGKNQRDFSDASAQTPKSKKPDSDEQQDGDRDSDSETEGSGSEHSNGAIASPKQKNDAARRANRLRSLQRYGLRNWKDILGMAAILGWDEPALQRTRHRCNALFEDEMPGARLDFNDRANSTAERTEKDRDSAEEMYGGVHVDGYLRPIKRKKGWRGKNKQKGNWRSRAKSKQLVDDIDEDYSNVGSHVDADIDEEVLKESDARGEDAEGLEAVVDSIEGSSDPEGSDRADT